MSTAEFDTIVAAATPLGRSALAIVRLDGPLAFRISSQLIDSKELKPRFATLTRLRDSAGEPIDHAIVTFYAQPSSYTGNDLIEFAIHGNPVLVERLIEVILALGARMAEPGEFTERAVLNGRIDLLQAEAIGDLIASRTPLQSRLALRNLDGELTGAAQRIRAKLLGVISRYEGTLDFAEEGYEFISPDAATASLNEISRELRSLADTFRRGRVSRSGLEAVILGKPNAGKSSLLNFLCGSERAIVTAIPGTTRDLLRETIELGGLPVTLIDTAGLRSGGDEIEAIGMERARQAARQAELVIYLIDASAGAGDDQPAETESLADPLIIFTKTDLAPAPEGAIGISVATGAGVEAFLEMLDRTVRERFAVPEASAVIVNARQHRAVMSAAEAVDTATGAVQASLHAELILVDLYRAANELGALVGAISADDVVNDIFENFCIGK